MSNRPPKQGSMPRMSAADTRQMYADMDTAHQHCLSLVSVCTQLGGKLRDTKLMGYVDDVSALTNHVEGLTTTLNELLVKLNNIRERDLAARTKRINENNVMTLLHLGGEYEQWVGAYQQQMNKTLYPALELIAVAEQKMETENVRNNPTE